MVEIKGVAHFSIPVSDVDKSAKFYTEIVGCKFLSARPDKKITFLDAGGVCLLLIKRPAPINKAPLEMSDGVHHAFDERRALSDYLTTNHIRYARAIYWDAYVVDFLSRERVILTPTDNLRISSYDERVRAHAASAVVLRRAPCSGGTAFASWCIDDPLGR